MARAAKKTALAEPNFVALEKRITLPEHAHSVAAFVSENAASLATQLIQGGKLSQGGAIAHAAERFISEIRVAFPNA